MKTTGYAAHSADSDLEPFHFDRRELRDDDVAIDILYCGVCHSDLHTARNDWHMTQYPVVPGHEIVGRVTAVGDDVTAFHVGDHVAVGCMVDSCLDCDQCDAGDEQFCREGAVFTYGGEDRHDGSIQHGGYSRHIVVRDEFVLDLPDELDLSTAAPILCAGITTWSPLINAGIGEGSRVGVIGLGGLGHMAVKLADAMGAEVTVFSRSEDKFDEAREFGADHTVLSTDEEAMEAAAGSLDLIINTIPVKHDLNPYLPTLDVKGEMVLVGQIGPLDEPNTMPVVMGQRGISGSLIGGIDATQDVLDFCAEHEIAPECEMVQMEDINEIFQRLKEGDVPHRFVIDMTSFEPATG